MMNDEPLIRLDGVGKVFLTEEVETHALSSVEFSIARGEYVSMEGPSGSGKTTLLSILGLLDTPSSGRYTLAGSPVTELTGRERALVRNRSIGFVFQAFNLIGDLTVFENVELPLTFRGVDGASRRQRTRQTQNREAGGAKAAARQNRSEPEARCVI